ncbi:hypothetical protein RUM43_013051 [Polyplax serrata]|uniref:Osiris 18 n=1 Tax=Polyplax serrata TaxID=468196 RepID=A0AAN8P5X0_POLSC
MRFFSFVLLLVAAVGGRSETAVDVFGNIFDSCLKFGSFSCVKPKFLKFLSDSLKNDRIVLTEDLSIEKTEGRVTSDWQSDLPDDDAMSKKERLRFMMLEKIDNFLNSHELKVKLPKEIVTGEVFPFAPNYLFDNVPEQLTVPLSGMKNVNEERGFTKKVIVPFLLGLKIKATTFIPLAIALIALKTWKALTLGLLSMVLSAAMVILKFAKPKVVNYDVYHYSSHHPAPVVEHAYVDHHGYGRSDAQVLAYGAHRK